MTRTDEPNRPSAPTETSAFPPGLPNAFWFAGFNALSFQIILAGPMILYAKALGASATILGVIVGLMPLLVIFQIPAASHVNRVGFKRFVLAGWSTRVAFIFGLAVVPLTGAFLDVHNRLALIIALLFCFNLARGISSCAWLPWIAELVPATLRGQYLARDAALTNIGSFGTLLIAAACLAGDPQPWQFTLIFAFSGVMGATSLIFLKRIPDVPTPAEPRASTTRVPWLAMTRHPPFRKLLRMVVMWSVAYGGLTGFTVAFLKSNADLSAGKILFVSAVAYLGGLSSLWLLGSRLDRMGSKPVLGFAFAAWGGVLAGWMLVAGGVLPASLALVLALQFLMGLLAALVGMATTRLVMAVVPALGRNHFFAIYSVLLSVTQGLAPVAWGLMIDAVGPRAPKWLGVEWNGYTIFFAAAALVVAGTLALARQLDEPEAASMEAMLREILVQSPQRFWLRFWPRG
jgi:MFS family permease